MPWSLAVRVQQFMLIVRAGGDRDELTKFRARRESTDRFALKL
jgi:hypothetical protein